MSFPAPSVINRSDTKKSIVEPVKPVQAPEVAPVMKANEADEPLLQENPQRFVLFPIKFHEVCVEQCLTHVT